MQSIRSFKEYFPQLGARVYVDPQASVIGQVELGDDVSVWPMAVIRGDVNRIHIGAGSNVQDGSILHVTHDGPFTPGGVPLTIGKGVTIGHGAILHACQIGNYCLIGMGTIILDEAQIEDHVMIAAGSVVPPGKHLYSGHLYLGNPVKQMRVLSSEEIDQLDYSAEHYIRLKETYLD